MLLKEGSKIVGKTVAFQDDVNRTAITVGFTEEVGRRHEA